MLLKCTCPQFLATLKMLRILEVTIMKVNKTISVDLEAWNNAESILGKRNISRYLNDCLEGISRKSNPELNLDSLRIELSDLNAQIEELSIKHASTRKLLKDAENAFLEAKKEDLSKEQFRRWDCGACHAINFMENLRCTRCNLPTRNDPKSVIFMLDEAEG